MSSHITTAAVARPREVDVVAPTQNAAHMLRGLLQGLERSKRARKRPFEQGDKVDFIVEMLHEEPAHTAFLLKQDDSAQVLIDHEIDLELLVLGVGVTLGKRTARGLQSCLSRSLHSTAFKRLKHVR